MRHREAAEIDLGGQRVLFNEWQHQRHEAPAMIREEATHRRERLIGVVVIVQGQAPLLEVVGALAAAGGFAGGLHGRQEQGDQNANNGDDDEQFHESERALTNGCRVHERPLARKEEKIDAHRRSMSRKKQKQMLR